MMAVQSPIDSFLEICIPLATLLLTLVDARYWKWCCIEVSCGIGFLSIYSQLGFYNNNIIPALRLQFSSRSGQVWTRSRQM